MAKKERDELTAKGGRSSVADKQRLLVSHQDRKNAGIRKKYMVIMNKKGPTKQDRLRVAASIVFSILTYKVIKTRKQGLIILF